MATKLQLIEQTGGFIPGYKNTLEKLSFEFIKIPSFTQNNSKLITILGHPVYDGEQLTPRAVKNECEMNSFTTQSIKKKNF